MTHETPEIRLENLPQPPYRWRGTLLAVCAVAAAVGDVGFMILGLGFNAMAVFPPATRDWLTFIAATTTAVGAGLGTLASISEAYLREGSLSGKERGWAGVSIAATLFGFALAWLNLLNIQAQMDPVLVQSLLVVTGLLIALDAYNIYRAFGLYLRNARTEALELAHDQMAYYRELLGLWNERQMAEKQAQEVAAALYHPKPSPQAGETAETGVATASAAVATPETGAFTQNLPDYVLPTLEFFQNSPQASFREAAEALDCSDRTISNHMKLAVAAGVAHENGNGWEIADVT